MSRYVPLELRIAAAIRIDGDCWIWKRGLTRYGYGRISVGDYNRTAHRTVYEFLVGPIPDGLQIDHLCRNRACVNPAHLEPVTQRENILRGLRHTVPPTHCKRGHLFDLRNTYYHPAGGRKCRACLRAWYHAHKEQAA
jgi:hypothetical protein